MSQPFLGQLQAFGFGFAPRGWALCNGQTLPISQYAALFALIGTYYGGNGTTNFNLPNLQSRVPMDFGSFNGNTYPIGQQAGEENVALTISSLPAHNHNFVGAAQGANDSHPAAGAALANVMNGTNPGSNYYTTGGTPLALNLAELAPIGGNQPHANIQPYLAINWCIAMQGIFPSRG